MTVVSEGSPATPGAAPAWTGPGDEGPALVPRVRRSGATRATVAVLGLLLVVGGLAAAVPFLTMCGLVLGVASVLLRRLPLDLGLIAGALVCVTTAAAAGLVAATVHVDLLARPTVLALALVVGSVLTVLDALRPGTRAASLRVGIRHAWIAYLPAGLAVGIAGVQGTTSRTAASWAFYGTDLAQHMLLLKEVQTSGTLDYGADAYPRALHLFMALVAAPSAVDDGPAALLAADLHLVASTTWVALALVLLAVAAVTLRLGPLLGASGVLSVCAAVAGGAGLLLLNPFVLSCVYMGAAPILVALVALWALPLAALEQDRAGIRRLLPLVLLACATVVLVANLWQALVIVPPVAVLVAFARRRREGWLTGARMTRRHLVMAAAVALVTLALTAPALLGTLQVGGLAHAATPGTVPALPLPLLALGLASLGWMLRYREHLAVRVLAGTSLGLLVVAGALLLGSRHADISQYYVQRPLWLLVVLLVPVLALALVRLVRQVVASVSTRLQGLGPWARVARIGAVACVAAAVVSFVLPVEAVVGSNALNTVTDRDGQGDSTRIYDIALGYATAFRPAVTVPVEIGTGPFVNPLATMVASKLMSFQTGQPQKRGLPTDVCTDARSVAGPAPAVVITSLDPGVLQGIMRYQGCADVRVVRLPGPPRPLAVPIDPRVPVTPEG